MVDICPIIIYQRTVSLLIAFHEDHYYWQGVIEYNPICVFRSKFYINNLVTALRDGAFCTTEPNRQLP